MNAIVVFLLINSILTGVIVHRFLILNRMGFYVRHIKNGGIVIDWWSLLPLPERMRQRLKKWGLYPEALDKTHLSKEDKMVFHLVWRFILPVGCVVGFFKNPSQWRFYSMLFIAIFLGKQLLLTYYANNRKMSFNKNAYRLYKFLHNQVSAGVQPKDAIMSLYKIVKEPFLKSRLQALGAIYAQTLDFEMAFEELARYYDGSDVDAFRIAMLQGISLGDNLNTLKKQESLMFNKYMHYLQLETNRQKVRTFLVVSIYCMIIIIMIGLPLMMELNQAINMIFLE
ncbi:MAG: hypothetical protein JXO44_02955 [Clostridia bacterium]|nr:hypothetical protein [Clostridia bacterium]